MTQLLQNAVFGTALILAAALLRRALGGRLIPEARLTLWGLCLIRLLAPVFPESGLSLWGLLPRAGTASTAAPVIDPLPVPSGAGANLPSLTAPAPETVGPGLMPAEPAGAAFPWEAVALSVWIGVGLVLAVRYVLRWSRTRRAVAQAIPLPRDDPRYAPLPKCARLREGVMDGAPLTFGAARPTVVLWPGLSGGALDCVLAHEGVHARRRDNLWHYAMALALVVYWWNPAVWLMARLLRRDIELACDRAAVRKLGAERRAEYAETLVALATAGAEPAFCRTFGRKAAEERILSVMKFKKTTVLGVVLSLALVAGVTVAFASTPKAPAGEDGSPNSTPYQVCHNPLCTVGYQHCHIDGEVVRAYDKYPGLLCAHPDCEIEGPHEHDGVQYAGRAGAFVVLSRNPGPLPSSDPVFEDENGNPSPVATGPIIVGVEDTAAAPPVPMTLEEYRALVENLVSDGKMTREDANLLVAGATTGLKGQTVPYLWVIEESGSYMITGEKICTRAGCGDNSRHTHDGEWYTGWADTVTYHGRAYNRADLSAETLEWLDWYLALPEEERLAVSYEPWELREQAVPEFVPDYDPKTEDSAGAGDDIICGLPTAPTINCGVEGCNETRYHAHNEGRTILLSEPCPVEGCTITGSHIHGDVCYSCNGAGHSGGVCDWSCYHYAGNGGGDASAAVPSAAPVSSGHHGSGHHSGHH